MTTTTVIGYTTAEIIELMGGAGIHCSLDRFKRLAIELQQRAIRATLCADGPAVATVEESEGGLCD
jgi:hypothetical protein